MKKSRIAKFALLGASAAALAATLSTSTYAWYVTNQKADVTAITGNTASADSSGAISLSATGLSGSFTKSLTLGNFASTAKLSPVGTTDGKTFYSLNEQADADTTANGKQVAATTPATVAGLGFSANASGSVYKYSFFILAEGETTGENTTTTVQPTITIKNTTGTNDFKSQINYSGTAITGDPSNIAAGATFYANALNALTMSSFKLQGTAEVSTLTSNTAVNSAFGGATTLNSVDQLADGMTVAAAQRFATSTTNAFPSGAKIATAGAQAYYNTISGNTLYGTPATTSFSGDPLGNITINNMKPMLLEFYLWLDGADAACFNACEQQGLSVEFSFQVVSA